MGRRVAIVLPFRERGARSTHRHHGPELVSRHIHISTTPAVRVQHEVTVHVIVKTSVQLGHAVAHPEWVSPPGNEQALRIHMDSEVCEQQHISFLRAKPWPHRLIYPATSSSTAFRWECIRSFFCCIAELAIKPCRSSRSKLRGEFGIPKHLQNRKQKHDKATNTPNPKHNTKQKEHGKCFEGETRGEKRVKRPKRPNALICRTPGGSIRYPLSCSSEMTLISHSIVSISASPTRICVCLHK